jgi:uncharacterized membrane protein YdfJ with MMPL/SSD domain
MSCGLILDAFVVRTLFVPALITIVGPRSDWPGGRLRRRQLRDADQSATESHAAAV